MPDSTAQLSTSLLRTSQDQSYRRLRELLPAQGVDPMADILADLFLDDVDQEFGVVVTTAGASSPSCSTTDAVVISLPRPQKP